MKRGVFSLALLGLLTKAIAASPSAGASLNTERGYAIFQQSCLTCHGNPRFERAPSPAALREMTPEHIYDALTSGAMYPIVGNTLSDADRKLVSEMIAGRLMGAGSGTNATLPVAYRCRRNPAMAAPSATDWNGWGRDGDNSRFQPNPGPKLNDKTVGQLKLKWAFGYPGSSSAYAQPTVVRGRLFVGTDTGSFYALNAETGCVYWTFQAKSGVRATASVGRVGNTGTRSAVFFGDLKGNVYALDARSGRLIWTTRVEEHVTSRITAAPTLHDGVLYVPVSSWEEFAASAPLFSCCTSVGKIVALQAATGATLWGQYVIPERPRPVRRNAQGVQQFAPAGGSVWNSPAVDPSLNAIYFGTGDATTAPAPLTTDAILSFDMSSGKTLWSYQVHANDSFLGGCFDEKKTDNCPDVVGPDWDIPVAPILVRLAGGGRRLVIGTKPGDVLALDPDRHGSLLWRMNVSGALASTQTLKPGTFPLPGMMWGGASDGENVFFGLNKGGAVAIRAADGTLVWKAELSAATALKGSSASNASPISAIPGAIFVGGMDGTLFALASDTGKELWHFNTARPFRTVNAIEATGGSIYSAGPVIVDDGVFVASGYSVLGGVPGNVLLAFGLE
jgi:polyvinyl alcohol dehydrogenase (cytochrome)